MNRLPACLLIVTAEVDERLPRRGAWPSLRHRGPVFRTGRRTATHTKSRLWTTVYELSGPQAGETAEFTAMCGWARLATHVRSETRVVMARDIGILG